LYGYSYLQSRSSPDVAHVVPGIGHLVEGAGVQPGGASWQHLHVQTVPFQVGAVDIGDLVLATRTGLQGPRELDDVVVIEVQARYGILALRQVRLLLQ